MLADLLTLEKVLPDMWGHIGRRLGVVLVRIQAVLKFGPRPGVLPYIRATPVSITWVPRVTDRYEVAAYVA